MNTRIPIDHRLVGYKFDPTDKQLVEFYLYKKSTNTLPPRYEQVIPEFDLYGDLDPEEIWARFHSDQDRYESDSDQKGKKKEKGEDLFFFTRLKRKSSNGSRINRKVGRKGGAWQSEDAPKAIKMSTGKLGFKKRLRYELRGDDDDGGWIMHEYSLDSKLVKDKENEYVLCRIRRNMNVLGNKRGRREKGGEGGVRKKVDYGCNVELTL